MSILAQEAAGSMTGFSLIWIVVMLAALYFMMVRPQQKETKRKNAMMSELAVGDTILTTSGFYGTVIDITEDTIIVEFGNNKNCRIPMQKSAIALVEKPEDAVEKENK
ncbi:MAG: preprotein translocase subunit YajC [Lachnospiraceae bacterium]|nr:preprotein translocase subunit YajC [Lachnospiraceae bacterium]